MIRRVWLAALLAGAPSAAFAHAHLVDSKPAAESTVARPAQVSLSFTEALEKPFSTVELDDAAGHPVTGGTLRPDTDPTHLVLTLPALRPGVYTVVWHATSVDTHRTAGHFNFTVAQ